MLKGLDPLLTPDLLWVLAAMGHGDDLAVVDGNFPAETIAARTASGRLVRLPGLTVGRVVRAVLTVLPIDTFAGEPVRRMEVVGDASCRPQVQAEVAAESAAAGGPACLPGIERFAFYEVAAAGFAVVQAGDPRPYGCFLFRKGVLSAQSPVDEALAADRPPSSTG